MRLQELLLLTAAACAAGRSLRTSAGKKLLLISFDGFRWDYDQDVDTPNLDQLAVDGVKAKYITPPMLTMTSPSHFTTITGNCPPQTTMSSLHDVQRRRFFSEFPWKRHVYTHVALS